MFVRGERKKRREVFCAGGAKLGYVGHGVDGSLSDAGHTKQPSVSDINAF